MRIIETFIVIILVLSLAGVITSYTLGGFIHILLVIAVVMLLVPVSKDKRFIFISS